MAINFLQNRRRMILSAQTHSETASGKIATISNGVQLPLARCAVSFSGTGRTGLNIWRTGKNLFDSSEGIQIQQYNMRVARNSGYGLPFLLKGGVTYTFSCNSESKVGRILLQAPYSADSIIESENNIYSYTYTPQNDTEIGLNYYWPNGRPSDATDIQIEIGDTKTAFTVFSGTKYAVTWTDSVTDGVFDAASGILTATSPTAGETELTPVQITPLPGTNYIWSDAGNIELTYWTH